MRGFLELRGRTTTVSADEREDKLAIAEVIQNWVLWRDGGNFKALRGTFHKDATMTSTWFSGPAEDFIARAEGRKNRWRTLALWIIAATFIGILFAVRQL